MEDCSILDILQLRILPNFRFVRSMVKSPRVFDRSFLALAAAQDVTMDDMYEGAVPDRIWYIRRETLKAIRARTGSQCSSFRDGVISFSNVSKFYWPKMLLTYVLIFDLGWISLT